MPHCPPISNGTPLRSSRIFLIFSNFLEFILAQILEKIDSFIYLYTKFYIKQGLYIRRLILLPMLATGGSRIACPRGAVKLGEKNGGPGGWPPGGGAGGSAPWGVARGQSPLAQWNFAFLNSISRDLVHTFYQHYIMLYWKPLYLFPIKILSIFFFFFFIMLSLWKWVISFIL